MFVDIYYKPSLFNAHIMILIVHIFMNVNKLCLNQRRRGPRLSAVTGCRPHLTPMACCVRDNTRHRSEKQPDVSPSTV